MSFAEQSNQTDPWDNLSDALRPLTVAYNAQIRSIAQTCVEEAAEYNRDLEDVLWETIDGHQWVIYTFKAQVVAIISDNADAWQEAIDASEGLSPEQVAYFAMLEDVREVLSDALEDCPTCEGVGDIDYADEGSDPTCPTCHGSGRAYVFGDVTIKADA